MKKKTYIKKSLIFIQQYVDLSPNLKIYIKQTKIMKENPCILGTYCCKTDEIFINPYLFEYASNKEIFKTIFHEIGHSVHYHKFQYKAQYLPRKHNGNSKYYCNSNQKESFAECFADYMWNLKKEKFSKINSDKRLNKMKNILKNN
ncbi:MAG: hypothetical protein PUD03_09855 [Lachnospiraceae bacterium]|nr:hypothetical protein [Lachnospiraceae bacterium]